MKLNYLLIALICSYSFSQKTGNYLSNSEFESWSGSTLTSWTQANTTVDASAGESVATYAQSNIVHDSDVSTYSVEYTTNTSGKGFLRPSSTITVSVAGTYYFGVWVKSTTGSKIKVGYQITSGGTTTYPSQTFTAADNNWHYIVQIYTAAAGDVLMPKIIPFGDSSVWYIDDASFYEGFAFGNMEWERNNGSTIDYTKFYTTSAYGGSTNATMDINTDPTNSYTGNNSLKVTTTADASNSKRGSIKLKNNDSMGNRYYHPPSTSRNYQGSMWVKSDQTSEVYFNLKVGSASNQTVATVQANTWTKVFSPQVAVSTDSVSVWYMLQFRTPSTVHYVDNIYLNWAPSGTDVVNKWDGSKSNNWDDFQNWDAGVPSSSENISIVDTDNDPISSSNITVDSGSTLTIAAGSSLTVGGDFSNNGTTTLNSTSTSYSSLKVSGSSSGNITYNRYVNTVAVESEWDLVGSPVGSQSISGFVTSNDGSLATNSPQYAIGTYSNASGGGWSNYTNSSGSNDVANAGDFPAGTGYQMASASGGTLAFTGTVATSDQTVAITDNSGSGGTKWNLVANPFPSYLNGNSNAGTNNFFSTNSGVLHGSFQAIYGYDYDSGGSNYTPYNATNTWFIAPGQAFFVASANASGSSVAFNENMQNASPSSYDDFVANTVQDEVEIGLYNGDSRLDYTKLFFIPGLTLGLDKGYDAGHFNQSAPMMTRLSEGDEGYGMVYNAMGQEHLSQEVTIPLEINQSAGTNFTVRLESSTADDLKIYLQDTFKNTLTLLNESAFTLTAENDLSDVGRFNLITTPVTLSVDDITNNNQIRIYKSQGANYITVDGLSNTNGDVDFKLYNITGALVMSKTLDSKENRQHISSENLINGVYFAVLNNGTLASSKLFIK